MENLTDDYNLHLECMRVMLGNTEYEAVKVRLNGRLIFNVYDDEAVQVENG